MSPSIESIPVGSTSSSSRVMALCTVPKVTQAIVRCNNLEKAVTVNRQVINKIRAPATAIDTAEATVAATRLLEEVSSVQTANNHGTEMARPNPTRIK